MKSNHDFINKDLSIRLMSDIVHSIRSPLASVKMRLNSFRRLELPEAQKDDLEVIADEITRIEHLACDFFKYSQTIKIRTQLASPSDVVDKTVRMFKPELEDRRVRINVWRAKRLPESLIDIDKLEEAFAHLISNGSDAVEKGTGVIDITETETDQPPLEHSAMIKIHDNGKGIPDFVRSRLFEPLFTTKARGTGMGLCIARQIVEAHGGALSVSDGEGNGVAFTVKLPSAWEHSRENVMMF